MSMCQRERETKRFCKRYPLTSYRLFIEYLKLLLSLTFIIGVFVLLCHLLYKEFTKITLFHAEHY